MMRWIDVTDAEALNRLNDEALGYPFPLEKTQSQLEKCLANDSHLLIGATDDDNRIIAYVHAQVYEATYSEAGLNVLALAVSPAYQGKGLGRKLMAELEKEAKARELGFIRLNSACHRTDAHAFYRAIGYTNDKRQERFMKVLS